MATETLDSESANEYTKLLEELDQTMQRMVSDSYGLDKLKLMRVIPRVNQSCFPKLQI